MEIYNFIINRGDILIEKIITVLIILLSVYIIYRNIKNRSEGKCNCSSCSSHCPYYKEKTDK